MATIITPVILIKEDINFDKTAVSPSDPIKIASMYSQAHSPILDKTGVKAAAFTIISEPQYLYNISLPSTPLTVTSGSYTITLSKFTNNVSSNDAVNSQGFGSQTLYVSAQLYDRKAYADGAGSSPTPFDVTVNYN
jgi:hypothetical protein